MTYTIPGYSIVSMTPNDHARHTGQLQRLRRAEGQVRGLVRMVEEERYCVDILTQIRGGSRAERQAKVDELVGVLGRFSD